MSSEMSILILCGFVAMASIPMVTQVFPFARIFHVLHHAGGMPWLRMLVRATDSSPRSISM
jgi:hypothetical protein